MRGPKEHLGRLGTWRAHFRDSWRRNDTAAEACRQAALASLGERALEGAARHELLGAASALLARILDVPFAAVFAWEPDGRMLRVEAGVGWRLGVVGRTRIDAGVHPETAAHWTDIAPCAFERLDDAPAMRAVPLLQGHAVRSGLSMALVPRGRPWGVLAAYADRRRRFRTREVAWFRGVARILAIALGREYGERALFEEMQMSTVLSHVGRELMACTRVDELLDRLCELSAQALRCDQSVTWLRRTDEDAFRAAAADGVPAVRWEELRGRVLPGAAALIEELDGRDAVRVVATCERHREIAALLADAGVRAAVFAPLRNGERVVGLQMSGQIGRGGEVELQDERLALGIAQLGSTALVNARVVEELERASQLKSEFVSTMSHELRTPLNIILGYTEMLADAASSAEQAPLLAQLRQASRELFELIDGTLSLNRLAAGGDVARFGPVALAELCRELEAELGARAAEGGLALRFDVPDALEVSTDRRKLKIVLKNLIANGLKFTAAGGVAIGCEAVGDRCRLTVRDTGIGIARDALPHVFEMFRQGDGSETRAYGGAGLGLFIVKSLLIQLGGDVQVESVLGQGSIFTVVLPLAEPDAGRPDEAAAEPPAAPGAEDATPAHAECVIHTPRRLLFADDLPLNRLLVHRFVDKEFPNVEVLEACDGEQAVAMFERERPHLVLLDLHMPKLDGWQAAGAIRRLPGGATLPVLALSVDASPGAEAKAVRAGFQEFIAKPISDYSALKARLAHWLIPRDARGRAVPPVPSATCEACREGAARVSAA
ncbi:MAG: response regulator [Deltaproteobacteria bacterium]|nr:response regulator [Deltaproteobacteria bacterium]